MRRTSWEKIIAVLLLAAPCTIASLVEAHPANSHVNRASCLIDAHSVNKLTSAAQGTLSKVEVRRGDHVTAGQIIARLESDVEQTMYEAARLKAESDAMVHAREADKDNADKKLQRVRQLQTREIATLAALEDATKDAAVAKYALEQAVLEKELSATEAARLKAVIERRLIRSPVDGPGSICMPASMRTRPIRSRSSRRFGRSSWRSTSRSRLTRWLRSIPGPVPPTR